MENAIQKIRPISELFTDSWTQIAKRTGKPEIEISSLPTLSHKLWGLWRGHLLTIGGRTSMGKSSLALQIAYDVALQGKRVYFLSLEMSAEALAERLFCQVAKIANYDLLSSPGRYAETADDFKRHLKSVPLVITYNIGAMVKDLYQVIEDLPKADVVIVDYLQAIRKLDIDKLSTINDYILRFRELAVKKNFAAILVSQINRGAMEGGDKEPQLWQLKGSGTIEEHSDTCLLLHWPYFYDNSKNEEEFKIIIAKQRNGVTGAVTVEFHPQYYKFEEGNKVFNRA